MTLWLRVLQSVSIGRDFIRTLEAEFMLALGQDLTKKRPRWLEETLAAPRACK